MFKRNYLIYNYLRYISDLMDRAFILEIGLSNWIWRYTVRQFSKRILRRHQCIRLPTGNELLLPRCSAFGTEVFVTRANVDWGSEALLCRLVKGQGVFLDIGANIGYYAVYLEPLVERVFAFEPDSTARRHLHSNVGSFSKISVVSCAIGAETSTAKFVQARRSELSHVLETGEEGDEVPVLSIDDFAVQRGLSICAIKIDVGQNDLAALKGGVDVLQRQRPVVLCAMQPSRELADLSRKVDYAIFAYAREPVSRKVRFVRVDALEARGLVFKMLFLVPAERSEEIRALA